MTIYLFSIMPEGFKELTLPEGQSFAQHNCLRWIGDSKIEHWTTPTLVWLNDEFSRTEDIDADFIKFSGAVVVSPKAFKVLKQPLSEFVEFLPVLVDGQKRYILNTTKVLDIMDKAKSNYKIYSDGKIGECEHAHINEPNKDTPIYKVRGYMGRIFVGDKMNSLVNEHKLSGALIRQYKNP